MSNKNQLRPNPSGQTSIVTKSLLAIGGLAMIMSSVLFLLNTETGGTIEVTGIDGPLVVNSANTVVNQYAALSADLSVGATSATVGSIADLQASDALGAGDLVMLIQMQGASITVANDPTFGQVSSYGSAGNYEYVFVQGVSGNTITFSSALQNAYSVAGKTQVIRVPQYTTVDIQSGASITATDWNGTQGGIVTFTASDEVTILSGGSINVTGKGFRGGVVENTNSYSQTIYYTNDNNLGAAKGESIAGSSTDYATAGYNYGRGAIANGGGGGNGHNAGGGGGANGNSGATWTGAGVMCQACTGATAWHLDPAYATAAGYTTSSGGGRGGYTYASSNVDALTEAPGNTSWGGDKRQNVGGLGGRWLESDADEKLFLGGGGGAGHGNNNANGSGGNGGGMVFIIANSVSGGGSIIASGNAGGNTRGGGNDAPGGGGGGGTIVIKANATSGITLTANGGDGGNQSINSKESEGPGGAGGGGFLSLPASHSATTSVAGGNGGTTSSTSLTEFPSNGATNGAEGQVVTTIFIHYPLSGTMFPVEWLDVSAEWRGSEAAILWATASESNSDYFAIERSGDGTVFEEIGRSKAAGFTEEVQVYQFNDPQAASLQTSSLVYRLRQVDMDGAMEYSPSVELSLDQQQPGLKISLYPNPATDLLNVESSSMIGENISYEVFSMQGQRISAGQFQSGEQMMDVSGFAPGTYIFSARQGTQQKSMRFVKQ